MRTDLDRIVGVGAGGHCRVLLDAIISGDVYQVIGVTDESGSEEIVEPFGIPVLGGDECLEKQFSEGIRNAFVGIGSLSARIRIHDLLQDIGYNVPSIIHAKATASRWSEYQVGCQIMANSVVNPGAFIGANAIVNTGAIVEHDCRVGDFTHVAPRAVLGGAVKVGKAVHIGMGSVVREGVVIGDRAYIAAGAVVISDVESDSLVLGVPARPVKK